MRRLNMNKLRKEKKFVSVTSKEALKDVTPINWSKEVMNGEKNRGKRNIFLLLLMMNME